VVIQYLKIIVLIARNLHTMIIVKLIDISYGLKFLAKESKPVGS